MHKLIIVGDGGVGKSALTLQYMYSEVRLGDIVSRRRQCSGGSVQQLQCVSMAHSQCERAVRKRSDGTAMATAMKRRKVRWKGDEAMEKVRMKKGRREAFVQAAV